MTHHARYVNADLAGYLGPVAADRADRGPYSCPKRIARSIELGIKGIGELGNVGLKCCDRQCRLSCHGCAHTRAGPFDRAVVGKMI